MKIGYKSDVGRKRALDEDSIVIVQSNTVYESIKVHTALLVLADGMGGHNAGEVASCLAAKRVAEEMTRVMLKKSQRELSDKTVATLFQESIGQANREIHAYAEKNPQYKGMGTTITAALVLQDTVYIGHVGDSRAYIINKREVRQLTRDHSMVQELVDSGNITREEARVHPQKNIVTRTVGMHKEVDVDTFKEDIKKDDFLLICCDGLTDMLTDEEIHALVTRIGDPQPICDTLVEKTNERGGLDNISIIVAKVDESDKNRNKNKNIIADKTEIKQM